jgi:hypothetical protein
VALHLQGRDDDDHDLHGHDHDSHDYDGHSHDAASHARANTPAHLGAYSGSHRRPDCRTNASHADHDNADHDDADHHDGNHRHDD